MTTEEPKIESNTSSDTATATSDNVPVVETTDASKPEEKKPLHDCIICDPFEACKHTVPLHETIAPLIRGKTGVEDMFLKASEIAEWLQEKGLTLKPKNRSKSK